MKKKASQGSNAAVAVPQKKKTSVFKILKNNRTLMLMCLPAIIFFIVFNYCPLPGVWIAFTNYNFRDRQTAQSR